MKKTRNLLFTLLVMGLIATPTLKVNATDSMPTETQPGQTQNQPEQESEKVVAPSDNSITPAAPAITPAPAADSSTTQTPQADVAPIPAKLVAEYGDGPIEIVSTTDTLNVGYKVSKVTFTAVAADTTNIETIVKDVNYGNNNLEITVNDKTFYVTVIRTSLLEGLRNDLGDALENKYGAKYTVSYDTEKNSVVIRSYMTVDEDKDTETGITYKYEYNVDSYSTVDAIMEAFEAALKETAPEANVYPSNGKLTDTAAKKLKDTTKVVKANVGTIVDNGEWKTAAEWTIDASKLTEGFDLRVDIDNSIRKQTKDAIEKLLAETDVRRIMDFYHTGKLPEGTKVSVYAGDKFNANETLTLYYYNPKTNKLEVASKDLKVNEEGRVEFILDHCSSYVLLPSVNNAKNIQLLATKYNPQTGTMNVTLYAGIALATLAGIVVLRKQMN